MNAKKPLPPKVKRIIKAVLQTPPIKKPKPRKKL